MSDVLTMNKVERRINKILDELKRLGPATQNAVFVRKAMPLLIELNNLKDEQLSVIQANIDETKRISAENSEQLWGLQERIMELESIPMTENIAASFIHERWLIREFQAYMTEQVERVFRDTGDKPAGLQ